VIVLDASAAIEWLLQSPAGARVERRIFSRTPALHAPHLLDIEVAQVLKRHVANRAITAARAEEALQDLGDVPLTRYPHDIFLWRVWELRDTLTAYDAVYVALAEALGAPLITCDRQLASAAGHRARVEVIR
jgi:predicted nucleic acid-binding protein